MSNGEVSLAGSELRGRGRDPGSPQTPAGGEPYGSPVDKGTGPRDGRSPTATSSTGLGDKGFTNTGVTGSTSLVSEGGCSPGIGGTVITTQELWKNLVEQHDAGNGDVQQGNGQVKASP